jgi:hypothetical protein
MEKMSTCRPTRIQLHCSLESDVSECVMANDPQENVDVTTDDELSDEMLSGVSGGNPRNGPLGGNGGNGGNGGTGGNGGNGGSGW